MSLSSQVRSIDHFKVCIARQLVTCAPIYSSYSIVCACVVSHKRMPILLELNGTSMLVRSVLRHSKDRVSRSIWRLHLRVVEKHLRLLSLLHLLEVLVAPSYGRHMHLVLMLGLRRQLRHK